MGDDRWWYTEQEWSKYIGWGKLPDKYAKPKCPAEEQKDEQKG